VTGVWRKLPYVELHVLCCIGYYYCDKISEDSMSRTCVETGKDAYMVLMVK